MLSFELAKPSDLDLMRGLQREAVAWLAVIGSDQWQPASMARVAHGRDDGRSLEAGIERREVVLAMADGVVVGMLTVDDYADPEFWTPADRPETALYVHRMVVTRRAAGRDIGGVMIDWAADLAAGRGLAWLRLDAWRTNLRLHAYYLRHGFTLVRTVDLPHRGSGALFQRSTPRPLAHDLKGDKTYASFDVEGLRC
jgi:GNAT superfamily N-acetyltransferase